MIKVLMIEDDLELADVICRYLLQYNIKVTNTDSPYNGLSMLETGDFELLILDLTLPEIDGLELLIKLRTVSDIPIIISSARDDILDKVVGLDRGADDYLPKPYNPRELEARIKSILRRRVPKIPQKEDKGSIFKISKEQKEIYFKDTLLDLTLAEYDILELLIDRNFGVVSREDFIYESEHIDDDSTLKNIDVMISRIRHKLSLIDDSRQYIKSIRGIGYKLSQ